MRFGHATMTQKRAKIVQRVLRDLHAVRVAVGAGKQFTFIAIVEI